MAHRKAELLRTARVPRVRNDYLLWHAQHAPESFEDLKWKAITAHSDYFLLAEICPLICSGRGEYAKGSCSCISGWKGKECELREDECEVSDCNGHGQCDDGRCSCFPGFKGINCEEGKEKFNIIGQIKIP